MSENCPSWIDECVNTIVAKKSPSTSNISSTSIPDVEDPPMDEDQIVCECNKIEQCASSGENYIYKSTWNKSDIAHLKEYTIACGMKSERFVEASKSKTRYCKECHQPCSVVKKDGKPVSDCCECATVEDKEQSRPSRPSRPKEEVEASSEKNIRTASTDKKELSMAEKLSNVLGDPFHIEERSNSSKTDNSREDWEKVTLAQKMPDQPIMNAGIIPIRGGEDYNKNSENIKTAPGRNSILDPDAIEKMANSKDEDTGARLKRERTEKEASIKANHDTWQKDKIEAMPKLNIVPKGNVFATEVMTAQPGLNQPSSQMGVYAKFDPKDIPDKTDGEKIAQANKDRKQSIQREKPENNWETPRYQSSRTMSDIFGESLEKHLKGK